MINDVRLALTRGIIAAIENAYCTKHICRRTGVLRTTMCDVGYQLSIGREIGVDAIGAFGAGFIFAAKLIKYCTLGSRQRFLTFLLCFAIP